MAITCTRKFNWPTPEGSARMYRPGDEIEDQDAAAFARMTGHGEERGQQAPSRNRSAPENKADTLDRKGGENKGKAKGKGKRAKNSDDETEVLGSEGEDDEGEV